MLNQINLKRLIYGLILLVSLFAIVGTVPLVQSEFLLSNVCPKILGIPACYIVLICFLGIFLSQILALKKNRLTYFSFLAIVGTIASMGTIGEITGMAECPRTSSGIPMCFISFGICLSLLLLKIIHIKRTIN